MHRKPRAHSHPREAKPQSPITSACRPVSIELLESRTLLTAFGPVGPQFAPPTATNNGQENAAVAVDADGDFVVVWQDQVSNYNDYDIRARRYSATGLPLGSAFRVNTTTDNSQMRPAVAMNPAGEFVVVWAGTNSFGNLGAIQAQRFDASGKARGGEFRIDPPSMQSSSMPSVAMDSAGNFAVAWYGTEQDGTDGYDIYTQRVSAAGVLLGSPTRANTYTKGIQYVPAIAMDADGDFAVAWTSDGQDGSGYGIYAQRFNAAGAPQGSEFRVNTITNKNQNLSAIAMDAAGNFIIAWQGPDGAGTGVYAQRYTSSGQALGGQFLAHDNTAGSQSEPSLAIDSSGNFLIAWTHRANYTAQVHVRAFTASGTPLSDPFRNNTAADSYATHPAVAANAGGSFLMAWDYEGAGGNGYDIYAQRYRISSQAPASVGDRVWNDRNRDGIQNAGEIGLDGVTVELFNQGGTFIAGTTTSNGGLYRFDGILPNEPLYLQFTLPLDYRFTLRDIGTEAFDSDVDPATGRTASFTLSPGQVNLNGDAGIISDPTITGSVFADRNANGLRDPGELALEGWTLFLDADHDGLLDPAETSTTTSANGSYRFPNLTPGSFTVAQVPQKGFFAAPPRTVTVEPGQVLTGVDFANTTTLLCSPPAPAGDIATIEAPSTLDSKGPSVAMDHQGNYVMIWSARDKDATDDGWGTYAQLFQVDGTPRAPAFRVSLSSTGMPHVAMDADGDFVIAWASPVPATDQRRIFAQRFDSLGRAESSPLEVSIATTRSSTLDLTMNAGGDFVVAWEDMQGMPQHILARRFNAQGIPQGDPFRVNLQWEGYRMGPNVAIDDAGNFMIAWNWSTSEESNAYARRYNAAGLPQGPEFRINTTPVGHQPRVTLGQEGEFTAIWMATGAPSWHIYSQRYTAANLPEGITVRISEGFTYSRALADAVADADGNLLVIWEDRISQDQDTDNCVRARLFNAAGLPRSGVINLATYSAEYTQPLGTAAAISDNGRFLVAWNAEVTDDWTFQGVYAQRYTFEVQPRPTIQGTAGDDAYYLIRSGSNVHLYAGNAPTGTPLAVYPFATLASLTFNTLAGNDTLTIDFSAGSPLPPTGFTFDGGEGADTLTLAGLANADSLTLSPATILLNSTSIPCPNTESFALATTADLALSTLSINPGARLILPPAGRTLRVTNLSLPAALDLTNNTLRLPSGNLANVESWLRSSRLLSSSKTPYTTLAPFPQPDGSILVKLVFYGDTNNDGQVNLTDYLTIDSGYLNQRQGFTHGDVNLDGEINLSDYFLIDSAYLNQQAPLASSSAATRTKQVLKAPKKKPKTKPTFSSKKRIH